MTHKLLYLIIIVISLTACNKENAVSHTENKVKTTIIKERDPNSPLILSKRSKTTSLTKAPRYVVSFNNYFGMSFSNDVYPLANAENLGFPVIDLQKLKNDYPSYFTSKRIGQGLAESFSYSNFERYISNSSVTKKVNGGFSLNLGLFKIGAKNSMTRIFTESSDNSKNRVFGELNIEIRDSAYTMQISSNIKRKIALDYLSENFNEELYNITPSELFNNYGGFVLSSFIVGGKAIAVYTGIDESTTDVNSLEENMKTDISASYGFKEDNSSGDLGFGKDYANGSTHINKITSLKTSIKTIGGSSQFASFTPAKSIDNLNIDMSGWIQSLNDKSTHSLIDIADEGLVPMSDFIIEENLKKQFIKFYAEGVKEIKPLQEPYLEINRMKNLFKMRADIGVYLHTRFGDKICLSIIQQTAWTGADQVADEFTDKYTSMYKLKCIINIGDHTTDVPNLIYAYDMSLIGLKERQMQKFTYNNKLYLLYSDESNKYAYSIHDDYLLDTYGIRELVNSLPSTQILPERLFEYTIIAL